MNNRYIFRGKGNPKYNDGEWYYGHLIYDGSDYQIVDPEYGSCRRTVIAETIGQCTGLTDKNGKLIFDGDVVKADGYIFVVKFEKCGGVANNENYGYMGYYLDGFDDMTKNVLKFGLRNDICFFTDIEVIGNIHDNPELLEVER